MTAGYLHSLVSHDEIVGREGWIRRYGRGEERKRVGGGYMYSRKNRLPRVRRWRKEEGLERREGRGEEEASEGRRRSKMSEQDSLQLDGLRSSSSVMVGRRAGQYLGRREQSPPVNNHARWMGDFGTGTLVLGTFGTLGLGTWERGSSDGSPRIQYHYLLVGSGGY